MSRALPPVQTLIDLVNAAGKAILPFWRSDIAVEQKADASPVTAADLAAHQALVDGLALLTPDIPILSEEDCNIELGERAGWTRWWLIDPLDGTKEFIHGSEEFTVNLALIDRGSVVLGFVGLPVSGRCYYGGLGQGAWCVDASGRTQPIQVRTVQTDDLVVVASKRHSSPAQEHLLSSLRERYGNVSLTSVGSSLKFCLLADGQADAYPRLAPTSQWDTAAAQGVLEGAGGVVLDLTGERLSYEARASYLNPSFLALANDPQWCADWLSWVETLPRDETATGTL